MIKIDIKYFSNDIDKITKIEKGNWIDLRAAETIELKQGDKKLIQLGIGMILTVGFEANIVPRSSTFKRYGIIQTNHIGVIDGPDRETGIGGYCGNNDQWFMSVYATRDTVINKNDRICQFRIIEQQPTIEFIEVDNLGDVNRGGFGTTGVN